MGQRLLNSVPSVLRIKNNDGCIWTHSSVTGDGLRKEKPANDDSRSSFSPRNKKRRVAGESRGMQEEWVGAIWGKKGL